MIAQNWNLSFSYFFFTMQKPLCILVHMYACSCLCSLTFLLSHSIAAARGSAMLATIDDIPATRIIKCLVGVKKEPLLLSNSIPGSGRITLPIVNTHTYTQSGRGQWAWTVTEHWFCSSYAPAFVVLIRPYWALREPVFVYRRLTMCQSLFRLSLVRKLSLMVLISPGSPIVVFASRITNLTRRVPDKLQWRARYSGFRSSLQGAGLT